MNLLNDISNLTLTQILVFGSVLAGGFYFTFYNKGGGLQSQIDNERTAFQQAENLLKQKEQELVKLKQFESDLKKDERSINIFLDYISEQMTSIEMFRFITQEAKTAGVNIEDKTDHGAEEQKSLDILKASLRISGSFQQIVFFLSKLTDQKRILAVTKISISGSESDQHVIASMDISAYRYKPSDEKKDEDQGG